MLPDLLCEHLKLVVCGTAAGNTSAELKQYYARPGNKFWATLFQTGLTPEQLLPSAYERLLDYGIGLTDLVKNKSGMDRLLAATDFGSDPLVQKIEQYRPRYVCFNGKRAAEVFFQKPVDFGLQPVMLGQTSFFVAPSTSGAANGWWDINHWKELARLCNA